MKRKLSILLIVLIFVAGIGIMSYPLVSSAINNYVSRSRVKCKIENGKWKINVGKTVCNVKNILCPTVKM